MVFEGSGSQRKASAIPSISNRYVSSLGVSPALVFALLSDNVRACDLRGLKSQRTEPEVNLQQGKRLMYARNNFSTVSAIESLTQAQ
ncbi:hypothetical protein BC629DRAFT_1497433 [Irpex lacteus]|nr:hypothetical protein BC629DRAFT_1497433 [Irpex lacteus]